MFETAYKDMAKRSPIHQRISNRELSELLSKKLKENDININFDYAIYHKDLATKVQTDNFELDKASTFGVPIFLDNNNESEYTLYLNFTERSKFILSSIIGMALSSIIFKSIIFFAKTIAFYHLIK